MNFCSIFNPNPTFTAVTTTTLTVSGMTLAGFVKNAAGGLLSTSPLPITVADGGTGLSTGLFGATTQIPCTNTTANGFLYSANLTFTNNATALSSLLSCAGQFTLMGNGSTSGYKFTKWASATSQIALECQTDDSQCQLRLMTKKGDGGDNCLIALAGRGNVADNNTNVEVMTMGWCISGYNQISCTATGTGTARELRIYVGTNAQLILATGGNVGVGVTVPTQKLDVLGSIHASGDVYSSSLYADLVALIGMEGDTSGSLRLLGGESNYTELVAQDVAGGKTFYLPNYLPGADYYPLISSAAGVWSWNDQAVKTISDVTFNKVVGSTQITSPALRLTSSTPSALAGDVNNWNVGNKSFIRASGGAADRIVTGILASGVADGHLMFITNIGTTNKISFANESGFSTDVNRILTSNAGTVEIGPYHTLQLIYDATTARWRELSHL